MFWATDTARSVSAKNCTLAVLIVSAASHRWHRSRQDSGRQFANFLESDCVWRRRRRHLHQLIVWSRGCVLNLWVCSSFSSAVFYIYLFANKPVRAYFLTHPVNKLCSCMALWLSCFNVTLLRSLQVPVGLCKAQVILLSGLLFWDRPRPALQKATLVHNDIQARHNSQRSRIDTSSNSAPRSTIGPSPPLLQDPQVLAENFVTRHVNGPEFFTGFVRLLVMLLRFSDGWVAIKLEFSTATPPPFTRPIDRPISLHQSQCRYGARVSLSKKTNLARHNGSRTTANRGSQWQPHAI